MAEDIQQQIADGARPLARVDDVIAHGEAIPANVRTMRDKVKDLWERQRGGWILTQYDGTSTTESERADTEPASSSHLVLFWAPLTVVEVDPEPQPAGRRLIGPAHAHLDAPCTDACYEDALDADGYLQLKGTATGDNQLDVPQPASRTVRVTMALDIQDRDGRAVISTYEGEIGSCDRALFLDTVAETFGVQISTAGHVVDFVVPCRNEREPDGERCTGEIQYAPGDVQAACTVCGGWRGRYAPAESGPVVLSLPQLPPGAIALVGERSGWRWLPYSGDGWHNNQDPPNWSECTFPEVLAYEGSVTVEFAPPREPRTWPKLNEVADWPEFVEVVHDGGTVERFNMFAGRYRSDTRQGYWSLHELRQHGEVREVLT